MKVIVCIDDNKGILFNNRRVSKDKVILEDIFSDNEKVFINSFSKALFEDYEEKIIIDENFLENAEDDDVCFVENVELTAFEDKIDEIVVYNFNRDYPSDFKLDIDYEDYELIDSIEFKGYSHEVITKEILVK